MISHFKNVFLTILTLIFSNIIMPNVFQYILIVFKLQMPLRIYMQPFDRPNLTNMVTFIRKPQFKNLAFVILNVGTIINIPKTIIFIDLTNETIEMVKY